MPRTNWFLPTSVTTDGTGSPSGMVWTNLSYLEDQTSGTPQSNKTKVVGLSYNNVSNDLVCIGFTGNEIPTGTIFEAAEFLIEISLDSVSDSQNVVTLDCYLRHNGSDIGNNLADYLEEPTFAILQDWGFDNTVYVYLDTNYVSQSIAESSSFGIRLNAKGDNNSETYTAYVNTMKMRLYFTATPPIFLYSGDTSSEVYVTLDLNPEVTNPTTTFSVLRGYDNGPSGYSFGLFYTSPQSNDPSDTYTALPSPSVGGSYNNNYLSTPAVSVSAGSGTYEVTNHIMSYNTTNLVAGQTYRRGLVLVDVKTSYFVDEDIVIEYNDDYDILYFNIEVIDTRISETSTIKNTGTYGNYVI